jgi:hypothetical protein
MKHFLLAALAVVREGIQGGPLGLDERRKGDPCERTVKRVNDRTLKDEAREPGTGPIRAGAGCR